MQRFTGRNRRSRTPSSAESTTRDDSSTVASGTDDGYDSSEEDCSYMESHQTSYTTSSHSTNLTTTRSTKTTNISELNSFATETSTYYSDTHSDVEDSFYEETDSGFHVSPLTSRRSRSSHINSRRSRSFSRSRSPHGLRSRSVGSNTSRRSRSFSRSRSPRGLSSGSVGSIPTHRSRGRSLTRKSRYEEHELAGPVRTTVIPIRNTPSLKEQGEKFLHMKTNPKLQEEWNRQFPEGSIIAYTDGSCFNNMNSGFGVYFGPGHILNRAERVDGPLHNSCLTEIIAAQRALTMLKQWGKYKKQPVIIRTDFLPLVQSMSKGVNQKATFAHYYQQLHLLAKSMPNGVQFQHVYGHGDDPGNQAADELARQGALSSDRRRARSESKVRVKENFGRGRSASRSNDRQHIRSHSAFVRGRASK